MPVKNRLAELQEASKYVTQKDIEAQKMDSSSGQEGIPMLPLKDMSKESKEFFERIQLVKEDIDTIADNAKTIRSLHQKIRFATGKDPIHQERLDDKGNENLKLGAKVGKILREEYDKLENVTSKGQKEGVELRMRKVQLSTQRKRFVDVMADFNQEMDEYRSNMKDQMKKRMQTINQDLTETEIETMIDSGTMDQIYGQGYMSQVANAKQQLSDIQDRHDEMKKLERSIEEVHRLFMEMQQLVTVQGEMIDNIAQQVETAAIHVEDGKDNLSKAEKYKIQGRKMKLIIAAVIAVILLILLLVILSEFGAFEGSDG